MIKVVKCFSIFVLIDTWWNVNGKEASLSDLGFKVLIDTWWNVNMRVVILIPA